MTADHSDRSSRQHLAQNPYDLKVGLATTRWLAVAFALYGLIATAILATIMPPFQAADEQNHFLRASQIADGGFVGSRTSEVGADGTSHIVAGGLVDPAVQQAFAPFGLVRWRPDVRVGRADWSTDAHWSDARVFADFSNTALYPPFFYLPSAIGIWIGRKTQLSVLQTLTVTRLFNGFSAVALGIAAIVIAGGAAAWIFAILTLPMSLSLMASASQDALLLGCSALAGALLVRAIRQPSTRPGQLLAALTVLLSLIAMMRVPYAALAVLPLCLPNVAWRRRIAAAAVIVVCVAAWSLIVAATTWSDMFSVRWQGDAAAQLAQLRTDPLIAVQVAATTLDQQWLNYFKMFVGVLGWLDTPLPSSYYRAAAAMLIVAAVATGLGLTGKPNRMLSLIILSAALAFSAAGVLAIIYVLSNVPGTAAIGGVQGRYFLPLALAGTAMLPALGNTPAAPLHKPLVVLVAAFPIVSLAVVIQAIVARYYLG